MVVIWACDYAGPDTGQAQTPANTGVSVGEPPRIRTWNLLIKRQWSAVLRRVRTSRLVWKERSYGASRCRPVRSTPILLVVQLVVEVVWCTFPGEGDKGAKGDKGANATPISILPRLWHLSAIPAVNCPVHLDALCLVVYCGDVTEDKGQQRPCEADRRVPDSQMESGAAFLC